MADKSQTLKELERRFKAEYQASDKSDDDKYLNGLLRLNESLKKKANIKAMLSECGMAIYRLFSYKEIGIGLWNPADRAYRYEFLLGHSPAAQEAHRNIKLSWDDMMGGKDICYLQISKYTQFNFTEGLKEDPKAKDDALFNRPSMLTEARESLEFMMEGDYFDIYMFNERDEMMGWIEVCNSKDNKFPTMRDIKWLELIACMLSPILERELGAVNITH